MVSKAGELSVVKAALLKIEKLQSELYDLRSSADEGFAIVGMSCRMPGGVQSPEDLWKTVVAKRCVIMDPPSTRCFDFGGVDHSISNPDIAAKMRGGYVQDPYALDSRFFGISHRELQSLDPQQRCLLELTWEAFEHAGIDPEKLRDSSTGVFVGITSNDYGRLLEMAGSAQERDAYFVTGNVLNTAAGRIAHTWGLRGPAISLDTACSSSLSALHLGIGSLRSCESSMAIISGVNLIFSPVATLALQKANVISASGYCKPFDAAADGYVRSEGGGVLILKRLSDALDSNDRIFAVVKGTAMNHVGPSAGLTVPTESSQIDLIKRALKASGLTADAIDYVETHGTGTVLGDPIEVNALGAALCQGRTSDQRLTLGSVKANIGHLESAAGMAGIIKVVMALQHKEFPPQANYTQPNPRIRWDEFPLSVPTQRTPWPANGRPRTAGVSGFGFGGTNAHVILQEAPVRSAERIVDCSHPQHLLTLSAQSAASLAALRQRYVTHLRRHPELAPQDLCFSANTGRAALDYRAVFTGRTLEELHQQLQDDNIATANLPVADAPRVAFLFTGQGAQYLGMGKELYANQPTFRETIDRCSDYILAQEGWSLVDLLYAEGAEAARLDQTVYTQPALFCVEYALATMWMAWGVTPSAVMGHSIGEYVAACVAQVFSLEDALKLVIARGRLMQTLPAGGAMAAVRAGQSVVEAVIAGFGGAVSIAAFNSPSQTVISGDADAVAHCCEILTAQQVRTVHLSVSHAFHSARLEPILDAFEQVADEVTYQTPQIPLISNLSAEPITPGMLCGRYWRDHARQPVAFARGLETLASLNCELWLEVGPHPVLIDLAATQMPVGVSAMAMLNRRRDDWEQTLETLGALYRQGWVPDWKAFYAGCGGQQVELPAYAWDRPVTLSTRPTSTNPYHLPLAPVAHQRFMRADTMDTSQVCYLKRLVASNDIYLEHHRLFGHIVAPGAMHVAILITVFKDFYNDQLFSLKDIIFLQPLRFEDDEEREIKVDIHVSADAMARYTLSSRRVFQQDVVVDAEQDWMTHLEGYALPLGASDLDVDRVTPLTAALFEQSRQFDAQAFYQDFKNRGYDLGKEYRWLQQGTFDRHLCTCSLANPLAVNASGEYLLSPGLIDSCFQMMGVSLTADTAIMETGDIYIPFHIENITVHQCELPQGGLISQARVTQGDERSSEVYGAIRLQNNHAELILDIQGFSAKKVEGFMPELSRPGFSRLLYQPVWKRGELVAQGDAQTQPNYWLIFGDDGGVASELVSLLRKVGAGCLLIRREEAAEYALSADATRPSLIASLLACAPAAGKRVGVAYLWGVDRPAVMGTQEQAAKHLLEPLLTIVRECAEYEHAEAIRKVVVVTRAAQTLDGQRAATSLLPASLWCAARVAANELTSLSTLSVDLDPVATQADIAVLAQCMSASTGKEEYVIREGSIYVPSLVAKSLGGAVEGAVVHQDSTYLITGGHGDLGMLTAQALIEHGAKHILLMGRKPPTSLQLTRLASMKEQGVNIVTCCCDVGDRQDLERGLAPALALLPPLKGVVHAAGVSDDAFVLNETWKHFWQVAQSKMAGAWNLHEVTRPHELDFFILYSSIASILGPAGQAAYASANAYMDALAQYRRTLGAPALTVNWGGWSETGMMAKVSQRNIGRMQNAGIELLQPESGFALMKRMFSSADDQWIVVSLNEKKLKANVKRADFPLMFKRMAFLTDPLMVEGVGGDALPSSERRAEPLELNEAGIRTYLTGLLESTLLEKIEASQHHKSLVSLGLDSMMALEIKTCIKNDAGVDIPILKLLEGASIDSLCTLISSQAVPNGNAGDAHQTLNATRRVRIEL